MEKEKLSLLWRNLKAFTKDVKSFLQAVADFCAPAVPRPLREMDSRFALILAIICLLLVILLYIAFPPF